MQEAYGSAKCGCGDTPTLSLSRSPTRMRGSPGACSPATASMTLVFRFAQPDSKIPSERIKRPNRQLQSIGRRWRNGHSVASRTWCLDRHGFGQCLGAVEVEARENPSWLAAMINHAASGSRIYVSSCDPWTRACQNRLQSGGVHIRPDMTMPEKLLVEDLKAKGYLNNRGSR